MLKYFFVLLMVFAGGSLDFAAGAFPGGPHSGDGVRVSRSSGCDPVVEAESQAG